MDPIVLNEYKETLGFDTSFACSESMKLDDIQLLHGVCGNPVELRKISDMHQSIFCSECGRVPKPGYIPRTVTTVAELRQWCAERIKRRANEKMRLEMLWRDKVAKIEV